MTGYGSDAQENQLPFGVLIMESDPSQMIRIEDGRTLIGQSNGLITDHPTRTIGRVRAHTATFEVGFVPNDKVGRILMKTIQTTKVKESSVHNVNDTRFSRNPVQESHIMNATGGNADHRRDIATQIQLGVEFEGGLGLAEFSPGEQAQTQIDRGGVQLVSHGVQIAAKVIPGIQLASNPNEFQGKCFVNPPTTVSIRMSQCVSRDMSSDAQMVALPAGGAQAQLNVAQAVPPGQLGERHAVVLISTGEGLGSKIPPIVVDATFEHVLGDVVH